MFEDAAFAIDERSDEFRALHPNVGEPSVAVATAAVVMMVVCMFVVVGGGMGFTCLAARYAGRAWRPALCCLRHLLPTQPAQASRL